MDLMEIFKVCFLSACIGWTYVCRLTQTHQLLDFIPNYYRYLPSKIQHLLWCPYCVGGWLSITTLFIQSFFVNKIVTYSDFLINLVVYPCFTMVLVGVILKQTELKEI